MKKQGYKRLQELRELPPPYRGQVRETCCLPTRWHCYPGSSQELFHKWPCFWPPWPAVPAGTAFLTGTGEMGAAFLTTVTKTPWLSSQEQLPQTKQRPLTANETKAESIPPPPLSPWAEKHQGLISLQVCLLWRVREGMLSRRRLVYLFPDRIFLLT